MKILIALVSLILPACESGPSDSKSTHKVVAVAPSSAQCHSGANATSLVGKWRLTEVDETNNPTFTDLQFASGLLSVTTSTDYKGINCSSTSTTTYSDSGTTYTTGNAAHDEKIVISPDGETKFRCSAVIPANTTYAYSFDGGCVTFATSQFSIKLISTP